MLNSLITIMCDSFSASVRLQPIKEIGEGNPTHSSVLAWRIPGTGEPGRLPSMGSHRVRHD